MVSEENLEGVEMHTLFVVLADLDDLVDVLLLERPGNDKEVLL